MIKHCERCNKELHIKPNRFRQRFCAPCRYKSIPVWNKGKRGLQVAWNKGIPLSKEQKKKISLANRKSQVTYTSIHKWIEHNFGKPKRCDKCGTTINRTYHWANLSGRYKRDKSDWLRLCVPCHHLLDGYLRDLKGRFIKKGNSLKRDNLYPLN